MLSPDRASDLPTDAGVYLFKDRKGGVLYVGKAVNLRARVRQYLSGHDGRTMVPFLVRHAHDVEVIVTRTEKEALLLENTLIKKHRPRFNVKLRDDSSFLHLRLDLSEAWPRYQLVRRSRADKARYFGPYTSAQKARETLAFLQRIFPLRTCTDNVLRTRSRPCLMHQLGRCAAPCVDLVTPADYLQIARDSTALLEGRARSVIADLEARMRAAAEAESFEDAARLRDRIRAIESTVEKQQVVDPRLSERDVWGLHRDGFTVALVILPVRAGALSEPEVFVQKGVIEDDAELLSSALNTAYDGASPIPAEIVVPFLPTDADTLEAVLSERAGRRVHLVRPERGDKVRLVELATENARARLTRHGEESARRHDALVTLAALCGLDGPPHRIECFDNSHLGGTGTVAAMAVLIDGVPVRAEYRRYRLRTVDGGDDYGSMREVITRRLRRCVDEDAWPDLIVIDGGHGQLNVALAARDDLGLSRPPMIGLSKPRTERARGDGEASDKIVLPGVKDPLRLPAHHPALRLLQHVRDQTHDHAVGYQRSVRDRDALTSALESVPGIGPVRRRALLTALGSIEAIAAADEATLAAAPGVGAAVARALYAALHPVSDDPASSLD